MRIYLQCLVFALLIAVLGPVQARSRMAQADISDRDGAPCFSISSKELKRDPKQRFQALDVTDASVSPVVTVWELHTESLDGLPVEAGVCITYGVTPPGTVSTAPQELIPGRVYTVSMNVRQSDRSDPTFGYSAKFCVASEGADRRITQVTRDMPAWYSGRCSEPSR